MVAGDRDRVAGPQCGVADAARGVPEVSLGLGRGRRNGDVQGERQRRNRDPCELPHRPLPTRVRRACRFARLTRAERRGNPPGIGHVYARGVSATRERSLTGHRAVRTRRRWGWVVLVALGILLILGVLALIPALGARARLETGRTELESARDALLAGELGE